MRYKQIRHVPFRDLNGLINQGWEELRSHVVDGSIIHVVGLPKGTQWQLMYAGMVNEQALEAITALVSQDDSELTKKIRVILELRATLLENAPEPIDGFKDQS